MSEERIEAIVSTWLKGSSAGAPDVDGTIHAVMPAVENGRADSGTRASRSMSASLPFAAAVAAVVIAAASFALLTARPSPTGDGPPAIVGASPSGSPGAIHWETDQVDLRADSVALVVDGVAHPLETADIEIRGNADRRRPSMSVAWSDGETRQLITFLFQQRDGEWRSRRQWIEPPVIRIPDGHPDPADSASGPVMAISIEADHRDLITNIQLDRMIRAPSDGEGGIDRWTAGGSRDVPICEPPYWRSVSSSLTFVGLSVTVRPADRSPFDELAADLAGPGTLIDSILNGPRPRPSTRELDCEDEAPA